MNTINITEKQAIHLSQILHTSVESFKYNDKFYRIKKNGFGLRWVELEGIKWIQQNPNTNTPYAKLAQEGNKVTWGIKEGTWVLIVNDEIKKGWT